MDNNAIFERKLEDIASSFLIDSTVNKVTQLGEGFINDTYIVTTNGSKRYILQRKNKNIFTNIPAMMQNINAVCNHIKTKVEEPMRQAMTIIAAKDGLLYVRDQEGEYWAMSLFIEETQSFNSASTKELTFQGGYGIGMFQKMLSDFEGTLTDILPGFHNMRYRFEQWDTAIKEDKAGRISHLKEQIEWINSRRDEMMKFWELIENGSIPKRVTHNDTKINNILFNKKGDVLCVIDLDTVLNSTVLNDFGDAIRSYTNRGDEDDADLNRVSMDIDIFKAYAEGYLAATASFLNEQEKKYLAFSARFITFEQVLRFLMDYINGDTYYKIKYPEHNLVRTKAQYKLLQSIEEQYPQMCNVVSNILT